MNKHTQNNEKLLSFMSKLENSQPFQNKFPKLWTSIQQAIHGTKHHKGSQLQSLKKSPVEYPNREYKYDIKESGCYMCNLIFNKKLQGQNIAIITFYAKHSHAYNNYVCLLWWTIYSN